jgi:hypothetical protein
MAYTAVSPRETAIAGGATIAAGVLVVRTDTNKLIVNPTAQTATALLASLGSAGSITTADLSFRTGRFGVDDTRSLCQGFSVY